jgi:hypothetical protein
MEMLKNYKNELIAIATVFGLISYTVYVVAAEPIKTKPVVVTAKKEAAKPADKKATKPAKEVKPAAEPKKDPNRKKPILKKKYADKK